MVIVIVDDPKISTASFINFLLLIAAVFIETLSAPLINISLISSIFLIPPPTVIGTKIFLDIFC